jgi:hypothetical protein
VNLEANSDPAAGARRERTAALFLVLLFCVVNFCVATRSPTVYLDEPQYCDPAANLFFGNGFTSTMWGQNHDAFWCGNVPLYQGILFCFFKAAGFGLLQARMVNTFLVAAAALLIAASLRRTDLVGTPGNRLLCVCLVLSGSVSTLTFRTIRPDATMFFVCSLVFYAGSLRNPVWRLLFAFLFSALLPFAGVPMLPYAAMMLFLAFVVLGFENLALLVVIALGVAAGIAGLVLFYNHFSSWQAFVEIVLPFTGLGGAAQGGSSFLHGRIFGVEPEGDNLLTCFFGKPSEFLSQKTLFDWSAALLFLVAAMLAKGSWRTAASTDRKFMAFVLIMVLVVPPFMHIVGHYRSMYRWMTYIPLAITVPRFLEIHRAAGGRTIARLAALVVILASLCLGLPLRTAATIPDWRARSIAPLQEVATHVARPAGVAVCDFKTYFALRPGIRLLYGYGLPARGEFRLITDLPTNDVALLCLRPESVSNVIATVGGAWKKIDLHTIPGGDALAGTRYAVDFYRREPSISHNAAAR